MDGSSVYHGFKASVNIWTKICRWVTFSGKYHATEAKGFGSQFPGSSINHQFGQDYKENTVEGIARSEVSDLAFLMIMKNFLISISLLRNTLMYI